MKRFLLPLCLLWGITLEAQHGKPEIGIAQSLEYDSLLAASGHKYLVESVGKLFSPINVTDEQFEKNLVRIRESKVQLYALNIFIPGDLTLVGPDVDETKILVYCEKVFQRCKIANVHLIVWGSGGARRIPDGFDRAKAREQFVSIARKVGRLAKNYEIRLALENLNRTETNFINTAAETLDIVREINQSNFKLCADLYHMLRENEGPGILEKAGKDLIHCDIAEKNNRNAPLHEDFTSYLQALKKIKYKEKIIIECRWENLEQQAQPSLLYLQNQVNKIYYK
jgi:sugar phosphate isomerase/epimerase